MDCSRFKDALDEYREGRLEPDERSAFESHAGECARCRAELVGHEHTIRLIKDAYPTCRAPRAPESLVRRILAVWRAGRG